MRELLDELLQGIEGFLCVDRGALRQVDVKAPLQPVRLALKVDQAFHVVGVIDARIGRIFADERVGGIDCRIDFVILVVGIDQIELGLPGGFAEWEARLQRLELFDGLRIAGISNGLLRFGVDLLGTGFGVGGAVAAAAGAQQRNA